MQFPFLSYFHVSIITDFIGIRQLNIPQIRKDTGTVSAYPIPCLFYFAGLRLCMKFFISGKV
jgi:hypothetical protein